MPQPIQTPTVGTQLQAAFNLVGRVNPVLDEVVIPVVTVADLSSSGTLPIARQAATQFQISAVAAEYPVSTMRVPGSVLVVLDRIFVRCNAATSVGLSLGNNYATPATSPSHYIVDGRLRQQGDTSPGARVTYGTQVAAPGAVRFLRYYAPANVTQEIRVDNVVIGSGVPGVDAYLELYAVVQNQLLDVSMHWREYTAI